MKNTLKHAFSKIRPIIMYPKGSKIKLFSYILMCSIFLKIRKEAAFTSETNIYLHRYSPR